MKKPLGKKYIHEILKIKLKFMKAIIVTCLTFIMLYTIAQLVLSYISGMELSPTLTTCVYTFFGTELAACAFIKIFCKDEKSTDNTDNTNLSVNTFITQDKQSDG